MLSRDVRREHSALVVPWLSLKLSTVGRLRKRFRNTSYVCFFLSAGPTQLISDMGYLAGSVRQLGPGEVGTKRALALKTVGVWWTEISVCENQRGQCCRGSNWTASLVAARGWCLSLPEAVLGLKG